MKPVILLTATLAFSTAQAQPLTPTQALERLFSSAEIQAEWFAPDFLQQVPFGTLAAQLKGVTSAYGKFVRIDTYQGYPQVVFERGSLIITTAPLDDQGRLTSFGAVPGPIPGGLTDEQKRVGVQVLQQLLSVDPLDVSLFSADFLTAVPEADLKAQFAELRAQLGAVQNVTAQDQGWTLSFEKGTVPVTALTLDEQGKISGLRIAPGAGTRKFNDLNEARAAFAALPGGVSLLVQEASGAALAELNSTRPLAVGSTFKLAILGEVQAQVKAGKLNWTDQVTLTDADKSLPSGTLQDAPAGSQYTLQDLATRMIRDSDNTATDLLLKTVGRLGVETRLGQSAMPNTRELFALKNPANIALLRAYRAAGLDREARRAVLKQAATAPLPPATLFTENRTLAQDAEWFVSPQRLCTLMADVAALPETQVNPGLADKNDFASVSFKGGSEPGVLNLTTQVTTGGGKTYCVSATWNRPEPLDEGLFMSMYSGVLKLLR